MARGNKRNNRKHGMEAESDSDESNATNATKHSLISNRSSKVSQLSGFLEDGTDDSINIDPQDTDALMQSALDKLECTSKSQEIISSLCILQQGLTTVYNPIFVQNQWRMISMCCYRIIRNKKNDTHCSIAATILCLLCFYMEIDTVDSESFLDEVQEKLLPFIREAQQHHTKKLKNKLEASQSLACRTIGWSCALFAPQNSSIIDDCIDQLWQVAIGSAHRSGTVKCTSALDATSLICSTLRPYQCRALLKQEKFLSNCVLFLQDQSIAVRQSCGQLLCVLVTTARKAIPDTLPNEIVSLQEVVSQDINNENCDASKVLDVVIENATCNEKELNSKDKKDLKYNFRRIKYTLEDADYDPLPDINCGLKKAEILSMRNWRDEVMYNIIKEVFGGSVNLQLRRNEVIRTLYNLGEPRYDDDEDEHNGTTIRQIEKSIQMSEHHDKRHLRKKAIGNARRSKHNNYDDN